MLTDSELRQAAAAWNIIEELGDQHEFAAILAEHRSRRRRGSLGNPEACGFNLKCSFLADSLAAVLCEPKRRCERAVQAAFGGGSWRERQSRDAYNAIMEYAAELCQRQRPAPEPDLIDQFNRYGLGAMLDYSCVRGVDDSPPAQERPRRQSSRPNKERANIL